ncbi:MAG: hypothetical protein JW864_02800 [Spirochaetes bacterium]|nr:hypothetical protein [Spirochaetota bacterium]
MTHEDAGKYAAKHSGVVLNERIASRVREKASENNTITCANVHKIAEELNVTPSEVGVTIDLLEMKFNKCQLGLFGYGDKKRLVKEADKVSPEIAESIESSLTNGKLPCKSAWALAEQHGLSKSELANICEKLKIKIFSCQIGAFK